MKFFTVASSLSRPLTDERGDNVVHALQEAGEVLCGRVVRWGDLRHDRRCLGPGCLHAAFVSQDICQAQDPIHLHIDQQNSTSRWLQSCVLFVIFVYMFAFNSV